MTSVLPRAPRRQKSRIDSFRIEFLINEQRYSVVPLGFDPRSFRNAFRFLKVDGMTYDVCQDLQGHVSCECMGFLAHHKPSKHIRTLQAARMLPAAE